PGGSESDSSSARSCTRYDSLPGTIAAPPLSCHLSLPVSNVPPGATKYREGSSQGKKGCVPVASQLPTGAGRAGTTTVTDTARAATRPHTRAVLCKSGLSSPVLLSSRTSRPLPLLRPSESWERVGGARGYGVSRV